MISAPFMDGCWRMRPNSSSAGGQLEHPSEVNSSTTTAFRWAGGNGAGLRMKAPKTTMSPSKRMPCSHGVARLMNKYYAFFHTKMQYLTLCFPRQTSLHRSRHANLGADSSSAVLSAHPFASG